MTETTLPAILELYQEQGMSQVAVAREFGVTRQAISDRLKRAGVPTRPAFVSRRQPTKKDLFDLYVKKGLTTKQIGQQLGFSERWIRTRMDKYGIARRQVCGRPPKHPELRQLQIGESVELPLANWKSPKSQYYPIAKTVGIKISAKVLKNGMMRTTREPRASQSRPRLALQGIRFRAIGD